MLPRFFKKNTKKKSLEQLCFSSIDDLPAYNYYVKILNGDLTYFFKERGSAHIEDHVIELVKLRENIEQQIWDAFGANKRLVTLEKKRLRYLKLFAKYVITGNKIHLTFYELEKAAFDRMEKEYKEFKSKDAYALANDLSKMNGFKFDLKNNSVREFLTALNNG